MIFSRRGRYRPRRRTDFHIEEERTKLRAYGFGFDDYVRVKDETGNVWTGVLELGEENQVRYYLTDSLGRRITGMANSTSLIFRDDAGRTWKGYVE